MSELILGKRLKNHDTCSLWPASTHLWPETYERVGPISIIRLDGRYVSEDDVGLVGTAVIRIHDQRGVNALRLGFSNPTKQQLISQPC